MHHDLMKFCGGCDTAKPRTEFYRRTRSADGLQTKCKQCQLDARDQWNRDNPQRARNSRKQWHEANPGAGANYTREWVRRNPDKAAEAQQRHKDLHPEAGRVVDARVRAKRANVASTLTEADWLSIIAAYHGRCAYCDRPFDCIDHVRPLCKGGSNTKDNVVPCCSSCNLSKGRNQWTPNPPASHASSASSMSSPTRSTG